MIILSIPRRALTRRYFPRTESLLLATEAGGQNVRYLRATEANVLVECGRPPCLDKLPEGSTLWQFSGMTAEGGTGY